ncbi:Nrap protein [Tricharina praecox]|uniref:Nrap protein n=1 Tax=Tricharina praecox TaxID=43433 RepID=UPI002220DA18|nr:Nrap protein [Tricharina praecox]KAI5855226.1 Nrap protein [Tricharina praecox]
MSPIAKRRRTDMEETSGDEKALRQAQKKHAAAQHKTQLTAQAVGEMYSYKSNVFRMETEEMLSEVAFNYGSKRMASVEKTLHQLKDLVDAIPERSGLKIAEVEAEMKKRNINIPFPESKPAKDAQYQFSFAKPSYVNVTGSYALKTVIKQKEGLSIDLVLSMPSEMFQEKDYMNYRYFHKRAYYLAVVASALADSKELRGLKMEYSFMNGDQLKPILVVSPGSEAGSDAKSLKWSINIIPSAPSNIFPAGKLYPLKNCVRPQQAADAPAKATSAPVFDPTPVYNASLAADMTYFPYLALLHSSSSTCAAFTDACVLGRVWLRQRGFGGAVSKGGFGHFEWAVIMAFLLKGGGTKGHALLAAGYSNYQMFKAMLQFLAGRNLSIDPLVFGTTESVKKAGSKAPVLFDGERGVNVLYKMTPWSYEMLRHEAERTLECLNNTTLSDQFEVVFLQKADEPCYKFDVVARLPFPSEAELAGHVSVTAISLGREVDYAQRIYNVLKEGLTDRASLIHLSLPSERSFAIKGTPQADISSGKITIGLLLNPQNVSRTIDRGPSPEEKKKAAAFRMFWGPKAELRRFPDGSIIESVTWPKSKVPVYQQIISHIFTRHFDVELVEHLEFVGNAFNHILDGGEQVTLFQPVYDAFDTLDRDLKSLTGIPLAMRHVSAAAPALRAATVDIPMTPDHPLMEPADVVVQFESSSRWPDDLVAIQKTKASFLIQMGRLLEEKKPDQLITRVGLENETAEIMNYAFLDVIYLSGPSFRIRIYHDREATLLENRSKDPSLSPRSKDAAIAALAAHRRTFVLAPRHTDGIRQLTHRFPLLSPTIRLLKRWFSSQLLTPHVTEEFIELLAARSFLYPFPNSVPASVLTGFLRTIGFLARWDWRTDPLILDISSTDGLKSEDFTKIRENFTNTRTHTDPAMNHVAMWVASNHDREHSLWTTGNRPAKVVAARITALARAARSHLDGKILFSPETAEFDFVLDLNPRFVRGSGVKKSSSSTTKFKNLEQSGEVTAEDLGRLGFDPVGAFVEEISTLYSGTVIFFSSPSWPVVGGVWAPSTARKWKAELGYSSIPVAAKKAQEEQEDGDVQVKLNKDAILNEIARIGGELVSRVVVNRA